MALKRLGIRDVSRLPVVERPGSKRLVGAVRRKDIIRAYKHAIVKRAHHQHKAEILRLGKLDDTGFKHVVVSPKSPVVGRSVGDIGWPEECLIVSVRRGQKLHVAHGDTVLQAGDRVTVFAEKGCLPLIEQSLEGSKAEETDQERSE